ncbi:MAG: acyl carrier protein [Alphaproteobacteria bacterium]|nr:acyl carrier protein [Alphaproteobacteria bacterium]MCB9697940.1 acyl carrier protein [Alphaproteobacteria bacterium]
MTNDEIMALIQEALVAVAPTRKADFANLVADTKIEALGLDSIATMEMVNFIEEKIEVTFPDEELAKVQRISDLVGLVRGGRTSG